MPARLIESLSTTEALSHIFSDDSVLRAMLAFEVALAHAESHLNVIPQSAAAVIENVAKSFTMDGLDLAHGAFRAGTPTIPLVKALTESVRAVDPVAARFVHWGATSQDVTDTALALLLKKVRQAFANDQARLEAVLQKLSKQHANTVMLGRTLLQPAPPVTFGLKAAGWYGAAKRNWFRLDNAFSEVLLAQLGGASGTVASLGNQGIAVGQLLAKELELAYPDAPWHTHRDRLASVVVGCGVLTGSLGKMARDVSLLMQSEVGEVSESGGKGRGGSSTMPHKRNPVASALTLACANRVPGLVANFLSGMVQEHERGVGGWHAEWDTVSSVVQATGLALGSMAEVAEGIDVNPARMVANIKATRGVIFAERIMMVLGSTLGRDVAHKLIEEATRRCAAEDRQLVDVLSEMPEVTSVMSASEIRDLDLPEAYLGEAEAFRQRLVPSQKKKELA